MTVWPAVWEKKSPASVRTVRPAFSRMHATCRPLPRLLRTSAGPTAGPGSLPATRNPWRKRTCCGPFPLRPLLAPSGGDLPPLPTPLADADIVTRGIGAKVIARLHAPGALPSLPYRLAVHARPGLGLWLECGPAQEPWEGVLLGACGCSPDAHGVGQAGVIPQRCTLHHPVRGMRLTAGEREFTAWGTGNRLSPADSYYVRLDDLPDALVFGPLPGDDSAELFVLDLC